MTATAMVAPTASAGTPLRAAWNVSASQLVAPAGPSLTTNSLVHDSAEPTMIVVTAIGANAQRRPGSEQRPAAASSAAAGNAGNR